MTSLASLAGRALAVLALGALGGWLTVASACNSILGIEERELAPGETADELTCELYCDTTMTNCTGQFQQYQSRETCLALCGFLELGTAEDQSGNTAGCRFRNASLAASTGELADHCPLAGPGSGGSCGDRCENYCSVMTVACASFSEVGATPESCLSFCQSSRDNPAWTPLDPQQLDHDDSIQCRLWHLGNASQAPDVHCGHADGTTKCEAPGGGSGGGGGGDPAADDPSSG